MERIKDVANQNLSWWDEWDMFLENVARQARQFVEEKKVQTKRNQNRI